MSEESCDTCRFWKREPYPFGRCLRRSPARMFADVASSQCRNEDAEWAVWPKTAAGDWCGEYESN